MNQTDISSVNIEYKKINFVRKEQQRVGRKVDITYHIETRWGLHSFKQDGKAVKFLIFYKFLSSIIDIELECILAIQFSRAFTSDDLQNHENQKVCVLESVPYILQVIPEITGKMGFTPIFISESTVTNMINNAQSSSSS